MFHKIFLLLINVLICFQLLSQTIKGYIRRETTTEIIPFASIGIIGKPIGTVSRENGFFILNIPNEMIEESINISIIGYESKSYKIKDILDKDLNNIRLSKKNFNL